MELYKAPTGDVAKIVKKYAKPMEEIKISEPAKYVETLYREVTFKKKLTGSTSYLYIDENNNIVKDKTTQARLGRLFFFMDSYLNDSEGSIIHAIQKDEDVEKDKDNVRLATEALDLIGKKPEKYDVSHNDIIEVKRTLSKLIEMRGETNRKLNELCQKVDYELQQSQYFDERIIERCMPEYKQVMLVNYDKVKFIARKSNCYGALKRATQKLRVSYNLRFITSHAEQLSSLQYLMRYFESLIKAYEPIINMSAAQYLRSVESAGKVNAEYKMQQLR